LDKTTIWHQCMMNYYEILEINPKAGQDVIETVYKILMQRYSPDKNANALETAQMVVSIRLAYGVLSDPKKRKAYDLDLDKAINIDIEFLRNPNLDELATDNTSETSRLKPDQVVDTVRRKRNISSYLSAMSRLSWKKWGWILSILAVVLLLFSMVQPDPEKAKRGQMAVKLEAERDRKIHEVEMRKAAATGQKAEPLENEIKGVDAAKTKSAGPIAIDPAP
jgi:DnaJ domain